MSDSPIHVGFVAPDAADLAVLFPGYEIQGLIATGGMGAVYCALQKSLDRTVAIKILPMEFSQDAAYCAGFEAEAKTMARLNHPNLIGVFDFGSVNGMLFIIMEFVPGKSIYHSANGIALDQLEVIRLLTGICDGLAHAHENGIIHRDIKPSNILLDLNAQPKIGDFGLARPVDRKVEEGEEIFGTPHYTAPEVVDSPHSVDYRADIFSVGVMLHELLTGKLPAHDPRSASMIARCDLRFDAIVKKATQPLPAARYSSAAEISKDLQAIALSFQKKAIPIASVAAPRRPRPASSYGTPKKSSSSSSVGLLLLAGAVGAAAYIHYSKPAPVNAVPASGAPPAPVTQQVEKPAPTDEFLPAVGKATTADPAAADPPPDATDSSPFSISKLDDAPKEEAVVAPKADVEAFFDRARKIMQEKCKSQISNYRSGVSGNATEFTRAFSTQARKLKLTGEEVDQALETFTEAGKTGGGKIPEDLDSSLVTLPEIKRLHASHLKRQTGIHDTFQQALNSQAAMYISGLEKEMDRMKAKEDPGGVALVEKEIAKTRNSLNYFSDLMLGSPSAASD